MDHGELAAKKDLAESQGRLTRDIAESEARLTELIRDVETQLLTAFHGNGKGQAVRMHVLEVADSATAQRLAAIEERILNLETRRGPGSH